MRDDDYRRLEAVLGEDWHPALAAFSASPDNARVYVLAVLFDAECGAPVLALNTERGFERTVARYPDMPPFELRRLGGARWNPAEFAYFDIAPLGAATRRLTERLRMHVEQSSDTAAAAHAERLTAALVRAVERVSPWLGALDRTPDFVTYVWPIDASEAEQIELTRRTVPAVLFDRLFPEVRATETFIATIAQRPPAAQATFWADALRDLVLGMPTPSAQRLRTLGRTQYDASHALVKVGPAAIPQLVRLAEEHALAEEWNDRDSEEWKRSGAKTRRGDLASSALLALLEFDDGPEAVVGRLQALLRRLHERDRGRALAGCNGQLTARALHALRPRRFPDARFSGSTNHLLNFTDFGVQEEPR